MPASTASPRSDAALTRLRRQIIAAGRPAGSLLAEAAVARELDVSRVPVREALFALEREGLVEFSDTGRAYVRTLSPEDFEELFVMRLTLEPTAARLAATLLRSDDDRLERNVNATIKSRTLEELTALDLDFHALVLEFSGNRRLIKCWQSLRYELELWLADLHRNHHTKTRQTRDMTVASHLKFIRVLREETPAAAERMMRQHILGWREWLPNPQPTKV